MNTRLPTLEIIGGDTVKLIKGFIALCFWPIMLPYWIIKEITKTPPKQQTYSYKQKTFTTSQKPVYNNAPTKEQMKKERNKMTQTVRERIKKRDNYTCQKCGISIYEEPHLLLEVDHIIPIAKGGKTVDSNLQCLCWKCNRSKGATTQFFTNTIPCWKCARQDTSICQYCPNGEYYKEER
jgi:hypothetical protein